MRKSLLSVGILGVLLMSTVPVLVKSTAANEITIGIVRLGIAVALITPVVFLRREFVATARQYFWLAVIGLAFGIHWLTYFYAIKNAGPSMAAIGISTFGIQFLLLSALINREWPSAFQWFGLLLCFAGVVLVNPGFNLADAASLGFAAALLSALFYANLPLMHQRLGDLPTGLRTWCQFFFALPVFLLFAGDANWDLSVNDWWYLAILGVVSTSIAHTLWVKSSTELPSAVTGVIYYLYVPSAMAMSHFFLAEPMTAAMITGATLIVIANCSIIVWPLLRQGIIARMAAGNEA